MSAKQGIAPFIAKLWGVLADPDPAVSGVITWSAKDEIEIVQPEAFMENVLPRLCNSNSMCSFVRQVGAAGCAPGSGRWQHPLANIYPQHSASARD
jgi:hypothetical protein